MKSIIFRYQIKVDNKLIKTAVETISAQTLDVAFNKMHERKNAIERQYREIFSNYMQVSCEINKIMEVSK